MSHRILFESLLQADNENEVINILNQENLWEYSTDNWKIFGGDDFAGNKSIFMAQNPTPEGAIIEKLSNSIDALILLESKLRNIDPRGLDAPENVSKATELFFDIEDGDLTGLTRPYRTELADKIHLFTTGKRKGEYPSITIADRGEGQSADTITDTFLSLGKQNKTEIPFVQGRFNQGGTATYRFCGNEHMTLIATRMHPELSKLNNVNDEWCFTIIRRIRGNERKDGNSTTIYYYLTPDNKIATFGNQPIKSIPSKDGKKPYINEQQWGSVIKLYNYKWIKQQQFNLKPRLDIENIYTSMPLPAKISDCRNIEKGTPYNNIYGIWNRHKEKFDGGIKYASIKHKDYGEIICKYAVYPYTKDDRQVKGGVFLTINKQVHGEFKRNLISTNLNFDYLKNYLRIEVDGTIFPEDLRDDIITTNRHDLTQHETKKEIEKLIIEKFKDDPFLKDKNAEIRAKGIEEATNNKEFRDDLINRFKKHPKFSKLLQGIPLELIKTRPDKKIKIIKTKRFPTFFHFENSKNERTNRTPNNYRSQVKLFTDVDNDYFNRSREPGTIEISPDFFNNNYQRHLDNGILYLTFDLPSDSIEGEEYELYISIDDSNNSSKGNEPFVNKLTIKTLKEQVSSGNKNNPNKSRKKDDTSETLTNDGAGWPIVIWKSAEEMKNLFDDFKKDDAVRPIGNDWYVNKDNPSLDSMRNEVRMEERGSIESLFEWGLVLLGISIKGKKEFYENLQIDVDEVISLVLNSQSEVIIPLVKDLSKFIANFEN